MDQSQMSPNINQVAADFAKAHGSFDLSFDALQNYGRPDDLPWTVTLGSDESHGWAGYTAEEAIQFAHSESNHAAGFHDDAAFAGCQSCTARAS